ncbi:MAG: hypothetical protein ACI395_07340 [Candidatus Cryptobacteroides sp.]
MKRFFLAAVAVFAVSAMFVSCENKENADPDGCTYQLFFNYGQEAHYTNDTPLLEDILESAREFTIQADIELYGDTDEVAAPFSKTLSSKNEVEARVEYAKLLEKAMVKGSEIIETLNSIIKDNEEELQYYTPDMFVKLEFSYMLLKQEPGVFGGTIVVETDCGKFEVAGKAVIEQ